MAGWVLKFEMSNQGIYTILVKPFIIRKYGIGKLKKEGKIYKNRGPIHDGVTMNIIVRFTRSKTLGRPEEKAEKLKGLEMIVCHDCKTMVIQIIKSSRTSRNNAIRNLTLDLSPVY